MTMTTRPRDEIVADLVELLDDNLQEMFQERAALRTEAGGSSVELAEALALADVVNRYPDALSGVIALTIVMSTVLSSTPQGTNTRLTRRWVPP